MHAVAMPSKRLFSLVAVLALAGCSSGPGPTPLPTPIGSPGSSADASSPALESPGPTVAPSAGASSEPTAAPSLPAPTGAWRPAPSQASLTAAQLQDVVWTGSRFEAVGGGFFLDSTDGRTWRAHTAGATDGQPMRIASGPGGLVAVGRVGGTPASWASTDGVHWTWHRLNFPAALDEGDHVDVTDVVATPTGWLAVGREDPDCAFSCDAVSIRGLAWTSTDGLTWARITRQAAFEGAGINAVAVTHAGFVAAGFAGGHAAIWTSPDGATWTRVPDDPVFAPPSGSGNGALVVANGVAARGGAIVVSGMAFGAGPGGAPVVSIWRSGNGTSWTSASVEGATGAQVFSVAATAGRFLATGPSGVGCLGGIWASTNGDTWTCEATDPAFEGFGPYAAAGSPAVDVAVGLTSVGWDPNGGAGLPGAAWWRPAP